MKKDFSYFAGLTLLSITYFVGLMNVLGYLGILITDHNLLIMLLGVMMITAFTLVLDAIRNEVFNMWYWVRLLLTMPLISGPMYLIQRKKLIRRNKD